MSILCINMSSQASGFIAICLSLTGTELSQGNPAPIDTSDPVRPLDHKVAAGLEQIEQAFLN